MADPPKNIDEVQTQLRERFNASAAAGVQAVYQYCISGDGGRDFYAEVDDGKCTVADGKHASPSAAPSPATIARFILSDTIKRYVITNRVVDTHSGSQPKMT